VKNGHILEVNVSMSNKKYYVFILSFLIFIALISGVYGLEENKIKQADNLVSLEEMSIQERIDFLNQKINEKNLSWVAGETSMSKLPKEKRRARLGLIKPPFQKQNAGIETNYITSPLSASYPSSLDWRNKDGNDWISPIKDQGECGACWAFSSVAVVESRAKIELNKPSYNIDLSEQDVVSCNTGGGSCSEGSESDALTHMKNTGIVKESCFAYTASNNSCSNKCSNWQNEILKVQNYNLISASAGYIKQAVNDYGPVTVYMYVDDDFNYYLEGIYSHTLVTWTGGLHSITIVGYNDSGQYWICKNSWGTGWGESGYFRVSYSENVLDYDAWNNDWDDNRTFILDDSYYVTGTDIGTIPTVNSAQANITYANSTTSINFTVYAKANSIKQLLSVKINGTSMSGTLSTGGTFSTIKTLSDFGCQGFEGNCILTINATDDAGKANTNEKITVVVDDIAPRVTANPTVYPDNQNAARNGSLITLNATIIDLGAGVKNAMVNVSQVNGSLGNIILNNISGFWTNSSVILNTSDGIYYLNITAYDNAYNCNDSAQVTVVIDNTRPIILSADANPSIIESNGTDNTLLNVTAIDNGSGIASVTINLSAIGGLSAQAMTNYSGVWQFITNTTIFGTFELPVNITDNAGNSNTSVTILLIVNDTTLPVVIDTLPKNLATDVTIGSSITATFSEPMNSSTLNDTAIKVYSLSSGKITGGIFEDTNGTWNSSNFQGFRYDEELTVFQTPIDGAHRIILENNLVYSTSPLTRYYQLYIHKGEKVAGSENYSIIGWLGDEYVAVNGTPNKLTKLVLEQKSYETKTLQRNEIWDMGDGYSLEVVEIDNDGGEAWLDLYKDGNTLDSNPFDNQSYWCVKDDIEGESNVPIFITYLDKVSDNTIQLKYTWLISQDVTVINSGEYFGMFEVKSISSDGIRLANEENVSLTRGSAIPLANDLKFEVEDTPTVRYCLVGTGEIKTGLAGDISYNSASRTVIFDPVSNLKYDTNYISYITTVAEDLAGNALIEDYEWKFKTMRYTSSGNGGGGGGGGGTSGEDFYNIVLSETDRQSVFKNSHISYRFDLEDNIVSHINFRALKSAGTIAAKVEILNNTSTLVSTLPPHEVFRNLNLWVGNAGWATKRNIADVTVVFTVDKSWINENNIDKSSIALYRYSDDTWHELVTMKIAEDANSLQFEAETPGFSPFAVTGKEFEREAGGEDIIAEPTVTAEKTPAPTPTEKKGIPGFSLFAGLSVLLIAVQLLRKKK